MRGARTRCLLFVYRVSGLRERGAPSGTRMDAALLCSAGRQKSASIPKKKAAKTRTVAARLLENNSPALLFRQLFLPPSFTSPHIFFHPTASEPLVVGGMEGR